MGRHKNIESNECIIRHINPNGTYRIEFITGTTNQYLLHDSFCESWLIPFGHGHGQRSADDEKNVMQSNILSIIEPKLPLALEIDYDRVLHWEANIVSHWFVKCGINAESAEILKEFGVNGVFLFDLDMNLLNEMGIAKNDCIQILIFMRSLRSKLQYNVDDEADDKMTKISIKIQEFDAQIREMQKKQKMAQLKFDELVRDNNEEYNKYKEWALKRQCIVFKMKQNQIRKPNGNIIKQIEVMQSQIIRNEQIMEDKQNQMIAARQKLHKYLAD